MSYSLGFLPEELPKWGPPSTIEAALYRASHHGRSSLSSQNTLKGWLSNKSEPEQDVTTLMRRSFSSMTIWDLKKKKPSSPHRYKSSARTASAQLARSASALFDARTCSESRRDVLMRHAIASLPSELRILILECLSLAVPQHVCASLAASSSLLYDIFQPALYRSPKLGDASASPVALRRRLAKEAGLCKALCLASLSSTRPVNEAVRALRFSQGGLDYDSFDVQTMVAALSPSTPRSTLREMEIELEHTCCAELPNLEKLLMLTPPHAFNLSLLHPSVEAHIPRFGLESSPLAPIPPAVQAAEEAAAASASDESEIESSAARLGPQYVHVVYCMQCAYLLVRREYPPPPPFWPLALRPPPSYITKAGLKHLAISFVPTCPDCVTDMRREASAAAATGKEPNRERTELEQEQQICRGMCKEDPAFFAALLTHPTLETVSLICRKDGVSAACACWWADQWRMLACESLATLRRQERRRTGSSFAPSNDTPGEEPKIVELRILEMPELELDRCSHSCCQAASRPDPQSCYDEPIKTASVPCMYRTVERLFERQADCFYDGEGPSTFWDWVEMLPMIRLQDLDTLTGTAATRSLRAREELLARCRQSLRRAQERLTVVGPGGPWRS
ncbi:hypothetical protein IE81DRAFT_344449 [Ceraceosorus guamensis]|uniref:Uncharacterized protein n=1 Tax=Ceraceosorus guamensis TaxID=1522189 RepID=A0A316WDT3_9BASI|nr:hypothetical protein IE81DRAFT_344449 [Ceraceosorus guamensis]PWN45973.1 hypothetical protein IE81DRAFT_344449 [Ceraceosorus guamensis]